MWLRAFLKTFPATDISFPMFNSYSQLPVISFCQVRDYNNPNSDLFILLNDFTADELLLTSFV